MTKSKELVLPRIILRRFPRLQDKRLFSFYVYTMHTISKYDYEILNIIDNLHYHEDVVMNYFVRKVELIF